MVAGAESSLAGAEQQWNDAMKVLDDKLQASPHHLIPALFPLRDPCAFLTSAARMLTLCTALTAAMLQC